MLPSAPGSCPPLSPGKQSVCGVDNSLAQRFWALKHLLDPFGSIWREEKYDFWVESKSPFLCADTTFFDSS